MPTCNYYSLQTNVSLSVKMNRRDTGFVTIHGVTVTHITLACTNARAREVLMLISESNGRCVRARFLMNLGKKVLWLCVFVCKCNLTADTKLNLTSAKCYDAGFVYCPTHK